MTSIKDIAIGTESRSVLPKAMDSGGKLTTNGYEITYESGENALSVDYGDGYTTT